MTHAHTTALRNLVAAFGGSPPDWITAEYDAACAALNTPDPMRDAAPLLLESARRMRWLCSELHGGNAFSKGDLWRWGEGAQMAISRAEGR